MLTILYAVFIAPLELAMRAILEGAYGSILSYGWAIVAMSLVVNTVILPIYNKAEGWQEEERRIKKRFEAREAMIKRAFKGQERFAMLSTMRRQAGYSSWLALRSSIGFFLQIPFFIAAYHLLTHFPAMSGVSFGPISNLGAPDALFTIGGWSVNVLPLVMTAVNLLSAFVYTASLSRQDKIQLYLLSAIFLILLYDSPAALTFYWTLNNVYSLGKNIVEKSLLPAFAKKHGTSFGAWLVEGWLGLVGWLPNAWSMGLAGLVCLLAAVGFGVVAWEQADVGLPITKPLLEAFLIALALSALCFSVGAQKRVLRAGVVDASPLAAGGAVLGWGCLFAALLGAASNLEPWYLLIKVPTPVVWSLLALVVFSWGLSLFLLCAPRFEKLASSRIGSAHALWGPSVFLGLTLVLVTLPAFVLHSDVGQMAQHLETLLASQLLALAVLAALIDALGRLFPSGLKTLLAFIAASGLFAAVLYCTVFTGSYGVIVDGVLDNPPGRAGWRDWGLDLLILACCAAVLYMVIRRFGAKPLGNAMTAAACALLAAGIGLEASHFSDAPAAPAKTAEVSPKPDYAASLYRFSKNEPNLVLVILDAFTGDHFPVLMKENSDLAEAFSGFVWYKDTVSVGSGTGFGLAAATGGNRYSVKNINADSEGMSYLEHYGQSYALMPNLLGEAWNCAVSGWVWPPKESDFKFAVGPVVGHGEQMAAWYDHYYAKALAQQAGSEAADSFAMLASVSLFRAAPYSLRSKIYRGGAWLMPTRRSMNGFRAYGPLRALVEESRVDASQGPTYRYFYYESTHTGFYFDEAGGPSAVKSIPTREWQQAHPDYDYNHYLSERGSLKALGSWLNWLKREGIYDNTRIVVVADHGNYDSHELVEALGRVPSRGEDAKDNGKGTLNPGLRYPLLIFKDFGKNGAFVINDEDLMTNGDSVDLLLQDIREVPPRYRGAVQAKERTRWYDSTNDWDFKKAQLDTTRYEVKGGMFDKENWKFLGAVK